MKGVWSTLLIVLLAFREVTASFTSGITKQYFQWVVDQIKVKETCHIIMQNKNKVDRCTLNTIKTQLEIGPVVTYKSHAHIS